MGTFFILLILALLGYWIYKQFASNSMTANDDYFEQAGVRVNFKEGTIKINNYNYEVSKVTGINTVTTSGGRSVADSLRNLTGIVEISVDDLKKPIHKIAIGGGKADQFSQRLCVAIRKAGGPDFY
jgi:hypothetical protein